MVKHLKMEHLIITIYPLKNGKTLINRTLNNNYPLKIINTNNIASFSGKW